MKSKRKQEQDAIRSAYFFYWKFQNDPSYREFWDEFIQEGIQCPVDFQKKIDWTNFLKDPDSEIIDFFNCTNNEPVISFDPPRTRNPFPHRKMMPVLIDLSFDKRDIFRNLSGMIDSYRLLFRKSPHGRDHASKFHLYAQVWDLRKGPYKHTFPEIGKLLKLPISTTKSRFRRAFTAIYGTSYVPGSLVKSQVRKDDLRRHCGKCPEREGCKEPCPDIIPYIMQDFTRRREKLSSESKRASSTI